MSRLTIDISSEQHQSLKAMAALEGKTIKQYTLERLFPRDTDDGALEEFRAFLQHRIAEARDGHFSAKTMGRIMEETLGGDSGD